LFGDRRRRRKTRKKIFRRITYEAAHAVFAHPNLAIDDIRLGMRREDDSRKKNRGGDFMQNRPH
ncbi:MAG: hypothetical protein J6Q49_08790, partial [Kiritimatiellae bacterium]|nr:hypothetical protein [Kiritimatiellia bacterium]